MKLFNETRPATFDDIRWIRTKLTRVLDESRLRTLDPRLYDKSVRLSLVNSVVLAIVELLNNIVIHGKPKASTISVSVDLIGSALRICITDDGGSFFDFSPAIQNAKNYRPSADCSENNGLWLVNQALRDFEYVPGPRNRLTAWRKLRRSMPHILIVTGDESFAKDTQAMLSTGFRTFVASDYAKALDITATQKIDAVIADFDQVRASVDILNQAFDENPIPVIMAASADEILSVRHGEELFVDHCVQRPFSMSKLLCTLEIALASYAKRLVHLVNFFGKSAGTLLSNKLPREVPGFKLETLSGTASYGGGDFSLALEGNGFVRLVLADIMGHGLQAKAVAIALASVVRTLHCREEQAPDQMLKALSRTIRNEPAFSDIITTLIVVDAKPDGWIEAASAAHPPMAVISPDGSFILPPIGPIPGLLHAPHYELASHRLRPGDKLAIVTDGIDPETTASAAFPSSLLAQLSASQSLPLDKLHEKTSQWLHNHLGPAPKDDWTLILAEFAPERLPRVHKWPTSAVHPSTLKTSPEHAPSRLR